MKEAAEPIETFPFQLPKPFLEYEDFTSLACAFRKAVQSAIPGSGDIHFISEDTLPYSLNSYGPQSQDLALGLEKVFRHGALVSVLEGGLLFSFAIQADKRIVVFVSDVDSLIIQRAAEDWLLETREYLALQFLERKQKYLDPETGLLNSAHLLEVLQSDSKEGWASLILAELPARSRVLRETYRNAQRATAALKSFSGDRFLLHHMGRNVYALLAATDDSGDIEYFSSRLVQYLKRENFFRVHVGSSRHVDDGTLGQCESSGVVKSDNTPRLLNEAWTALQEAARRGPFSFCDFSLLVNAHTHPLRKHRASIISSFRRVSGKHERFCIIKLSVSESEECSGPTGRLKSVLLDVEVPIGAELRILGTDRGVVLFVSGLDSVGGLKLADTIIGTLKGIKNFSTVYAGVSCFPYFDFSRSETLQNSHKALLHAEFFGPGHAVLFDAVSLNISGDIYFGDGDLPKAIREYRLGLFCEPKDVNLLNSLGVTYALMNRDSLARKAFLQALDVDHQNYMAHYNLGLGAQQKNDPATALHHFRMAHLLCEEVVQQHDVCCDLRLQLGKLCCWSGEYEQSVKYLTLWKDSMPDSEHYRVLRYLGEAYLGDGKTRQALPILQKSLSRHPFDAEVMSMLGEAVWKAGEGDQIALSLCKKSVELEPRDSMLRLRLAKVLYHTGESRGALGNLKKCVGRGVDPVEVQLLKAQAYADLKQKGRARNWAEKVMAQCEKGGVFYTEADLLIASL